MDKSNQKVVGLGGKLPVHDTDEFARRFGPSLSRGGIYLRTRQFVAPGTPVLLDLKRADGQSLIRCRGKVEFVTGHGGEGTPGLGIRFLELDKASRAVLDKVLAGKPGAEEDSPPVPDGVGPLHYRVEPAQPEPHAGATVLSAREVGELFHVGMPQGQWMPVAEPRREEASQAAAAVAALRQELSFELKSLRRQVAWGAALAVVAVVAAFLGGRLSVREAALPVGVAAAPVEAAPVAAVQALPSSAQAAVQPAALPAEDALADFEPAVEEELTAEEAARANEVLAATAPAPAPRRKAPPSPAPARKRDAPTAAPRAHEKGRPSAQAAAPRVGPPSAALPLQAEPTAAAEAEPEEEQLVNAALAAPRGSACKERMGALTQLVARTRLLAHREAGIVLRARCLSDTWRVDEARAEFRRYLREFPKGRYAAEAARVLAD